jgi:hypothetical protein
VERGAPVPRAIAEVLIDVEQKCGARLQRSRELANGARRIGRMMHHPVRVARIEDLVGKRQLQ